MQSKKICLFILLVILTYTPLSQAFETKEILPENLKTFLNDPPHKVKLLYFFTSWCSVCKKVLPQVMDVHNHFEKDKVEVIFISLDGDDKLLKDYFREFNTDKISIFRINQSDHQKVLKGMHDAGIVYHGSIPHFTLIDSSGNIVVNGSYQVEGLKKGIAYLIRN